MWDGSARQREAERLATGDARAGGGRADDLHLDPDAVRPQPGLEAVERLQVAAQCDGLDEDQRRARPDLELLRQLGLGMRGHERATAAVDGEALALLEAVVQRALFVLEREGGLGEVRRQAV